MTARRSAASTTGTRPPARIKHGFGRSRSTSNRAPRCAPAAPHRRLTRRRLRSGQASTAGARGRRGPGSIRPDHAVVASPPLRLHRALPPQQCCPSALWPMAARDKARRLPADGLARRRACAAVHPQGQRLECTLPADRGRDCRLIDGEAVCCDENGLAVFQELRRRRNQDSVFLYAFDLLELDGADLRREPIETRKAALAKLLRRQKPGLRLSEHIEGDGATVYQHAAALGAEGIVSKRKRS